MSALSPDELLEEIRDGLSASAWNQAVRCVRAGEAVIFNRDGDVWQLDVSMGRPLPYRVELDLADGDWDCPCASRDDACVHVAAAALALTQADRAPAPPRPVTDGPHLSHRIEIDQDQWSLVSYRVEGEGDPGVPVVDLAEPGLLLSPGDQAVVGFPGWERSGGRRVLRRIPAARLPQLLEALSLAADVRVAGRPVAVMAQPVASVLVVEDHAGGLRVGLGPAGVHHLTLPGIPELVVVGDPPTLRPLGPSTLSHEQADRYRQGRIIRKEKIPAFLTEVLPRLRARTAVEMRADGAPRPVNIRPYALLRLMEADDGVDAIATVTYGRPPLAVVIGDRLHLLGAGKSLPQRLHREERRLSAMIEESVGVPPGRRRRLRGTEAGRFLAALTPIFEGEIQGQELIGRMRVREAPLTPRWVAGAAGAPTLRFAVEGGASGEGAEEASPQAVLAAWREGRSLVQLLDGGFARLPAQWMEEWGPLLETLFDARPEVEPYRAIAQAQLLEAAEVDADLEAVRRAARARLEIPPATPPAGLTASLRPYQLEGLAWLRHLAAQGMGGILADDMGLGKTLQALALILSDAAEPGPSLIVAPTSVLHGWEGEAARFAPSLKVRRYHGAGRSLEGLRPGELVVTSYALLRRDIDALGAIPWRRVVLDEAQAIKNPHSQVARAARRLTAERRLALTGTPVENRLAELWSILDFVNPGILGSRRLFEERYGALEGSGRDEAVRRLRVRVRPFILRRLKQEVARDLPPKTEVVLRCALSGGERRLYDALLASSRAEVRRLMGDGRRHIQILELLLRLRQACCHAGLVPGAGELGAKPSSKVKLLMSQLEVVVAEGHKALVFSQWTGLLDRVEPALKRAGIPWVRLDGSTRDRQGVVERFQADDGPPVFLISLKAGGTGLNLTAADYVYLMDPWWNPAVEAQAIDRTYRIGQTRPVLATRLVAEDTIEERVLDLQARKQALTDAALGGEEGWIASLSGDELEALLAD